MPDAFTASASYIIKDYLAELRRAIEGLDDEAVNWKPAGDETNSLAVLVTHNLHSTRLWLSVALDTPLPDRERDREFEATAGNADDLLSIVDDIGAQVLALLDGAQDVNWTDNRQAKLPPDPDLPGYIPAAFAILHAVEHFSQHVGHATLTRQLWDARAGR
jgi:hypothetical protein